MLEKDNTMKVPTKQIMERQETMARHSQEYTAALQRAKTLHVPHAFNPPSQYGTFDDEVEENSREPEAEFSVSSSNKSRADESWDVLIERLFDKDEHGKMVFKR